MGKWLTAAQVTGRKAREIKPRPKRKWGAKAPAILPPPPPLEELLEQSVRVLCEITEGDDGLIDFLLKEGRELLADLRRSGYDPMRIRLERDYKRATTPTPAAGGKEGE